MADTDDTVLPCEGPGSLSAHKFHLHDRHVRYFINIDELKVFLAIMGLDMQSSADVKHVFEVAKGNRIDGSTDSKRFYNGEIAQ